MPKRVYAMRAGWDIPDRHGCRAIHDLGWTAYKRRHALEVVWAILWVVWSVLMAGEPRWRGATQGGGVVVHRGESARGPRRHKDTGGDHGSEREYDYDGLQRVALRGDRGQSAGRSFGVDPVPFRTRRGAATQPPPAHRRPVMPPPGTRIPVTRGAACRYSGAAFHPVRVGSLQPQGFANMERRRRGGRRR